MDASIPETLPYCIWYPKLALESTYRELVKRYPTLKYQVARACAVANYSALYQELEILPEVAVAEEARASGSVIYKMAMDQPVRYRVMDDYERTILSHPRPAFLNADTAVAPLLKHTFAYDTPWYSMPTPVFDLLEDQHLGLEFVPYDGDEFGAEDQWLLYAPLHGDLPSMPDKDLLILMAPITATWIGPCVSGGPG